MDWIHTWPGWQIIDDEWSHSVPVFIYLFICTSIYPITWHPLFLLSKGFIQSRQYTSLVWDYCAVAVWLELPLFISIFTKPAKTLWVWIPLKQKGAHVGQQDTESIIFVMLLLRMNILFRRMESKLFSSWLQTRSFIQLSVNLDIFIL